VIAAPSSADTTESRLRASALLCKAFMRFEISDNISGEDVTEHWVQVLDYLDRLMRTDQNDQLSEAVLESLKNVILVMHAAGILAVEHGDTRDELQRQLWHVTHDKIERFMPGFMESVIPLSSATVPSSIEPSTTATATTEKLDSQAPDVAASETATEPFARASIV